MADLGTHQGPATATPTVAGTAKNNAAGQPVLGTHHVQTGTPYYALPSYAPTTGGPAPRTTGQVWPQ